MEASLSDVYIVFVLVMVVSLIMQRLDLMSGLLNSWLIFYMSVYMYTSSILENISVQY